MKKAILVILDGFGCRKETLGNAVRNANAPFFRSLTEKYPWGLVHTSGRYVGLPDGQMGNSEVGHINIGAGRIVYQDSTRISKSIEDGDFYTNDVLLNAIEEAKKRKSKIHLMGLVSDGGVHSRPDHLYAILDLLKQNNFSDVFIHAFMDGRDTAPDSGIRHIRSLEEKLKTVSVGQIATVSGRYYSMDRDKRWERLALAFNAFTSKSGSYKSAEEGIKASYENNEYDEFIKPFYIEKDGNAITGINENDIIISFNFRADRVRQLSRAFSDSMFNGFDVPVKVKYFVQFTEYDAGFPLKTVFRKEAIGGTIGEIISRYGMKQLRAAETEKYAHVTFFFNGGVEDVFKNEDRLLVNSPKVATYDLQPEMSAFELTDKLIDKMSEKDYELVVVNYANSDMVGHTGVYDAAVKAIESLDKCLEKLVNHSLNNDYDVLITADHGNAEQMYDENGKPFTQHTTGPVPLLYIGEKFKGIKEGGRLCDIAPSLLQILEIEQEKEMSGFPLLIK